MPNGGLRNNDTTALRAALGIVSPEEPESIAPIDVPNAEENETASEIKEAKTVSLEDKASKYFDRRPTDLSPQIEGTFSSLKAVWEADDEDILHEKQGSNAASQEDPLAIEFQELIGDDESVEDFCESADFLETESEDESSTDDQKAVSEDLSEEEEDSDDDINELLEAVTDYDDEEAEEEAEQEEEPEEPEEEEEEEPLDPEASLAATRAIESSYINLREYIKDGNKPKESGIAAAIKGKK